MEYKSEVFFIISLPKQSDLMPVDLGDGVAFTVVLKDSSYNHMFQYLERDY